jgi:hypothetical protein
MNIPVAIYSMFLLLLDTLLLGIQVDLQAFLSMFLLLLDTLLLGIQVDIVAFLNCCQISSLKFKLHLQHIFSSTPRYAIVLGVQVSTVPGAYTTCPFSPVPSTH